MNYIKVLSDNNRSIPMENFGTETSATSSFVPAHGSTGMKGAGFLFGHDDGARAIQACKEKEFGALSFLIRKDMVSDFSVRDPDTGSTLLHCVVRFSRDIPHVREVLDKILTNNYVLSFINLQDKDGNTPLHIALETGNHSLCDLLIKVGADPKIRNNLSRYIALDTGVGPGVSPSGVQCQSPRHSVFAPKMEDRSPGAKSRDRCVFKYHPHHGRCMFENDPVSARGDSDVNDIVNMLLQMDRGDRSEWSAAMPTTLGNTESQFQSDLFNTDKFLDQIVSSKPGQGRGRGEPLNRVPVNLQTVMMGGQKEIKGSRRMNTYSEYNLAPETSDVDVVGGAGAGTDPRFGTRGVSRTDWDEFGATMAGRDDSRAESRGASRGSAQGSTRGSTSTRDAGRETSTRDPSLQRETGTKPRKQGRPGSLGREGESKSAKKGAKSARDCPTDSDSDSETAGLGRQTKDQIEVIRDRTMRKIMEIMNVGEDIAKNYRAAIYRRVQTEHPELGSYDRHVEMEKLATRENLEKIDIEAVTREIKQHIEQKQKDRPPGAPSGERRRRDSVESQGSTGSTTSESETPAPKKRRAPRKKDVDTSSASEMSESGMSPTSVG